MAKRTLGLGKAAKDAKKKKAEPKEDAPANELTVELTEEVDADDEMAQLHGLWSTYFKSDKENELVLNGIVHECDRLLRNADGAPLADSFHAVYALALADLALFHTEDRSKVGEYFDAALERVQLGLEQFPLLATLLSAKARILVNRIPLQHIAHLAVDSTGAGLETQLDEALQLYEQAWDHVQPALINSETFLFFEALDDLLDMVENFGGRSDAGNDVESGDESDDEEVQIGETHPLYAIQRDNKYTQWWLHFVAKFENKVDAKQQPELHRQVSRRVGQWHLQSAAIPASVFTKLAYEDDYEGVGELHGMTQLEAQVRAQTHLKSALAYLQLAQEDDGPALWVAVAETMILLGNVLDLDSKEQEAHYEEAEKIVRRANKVTQGKYQEILDNMA